jgi:sigma-E factor negative regulatory protein RseB
MACGRWPAWLVVMGACMGMPVLSHAEDAASTTAKQWLMRIQQASRERTYSGVSVNTVAGVMAASRVIHLVESGQVIERVDTLDGDAHITLRQGDQLHQLWPQRKLMVSENRSDQLTLPSSVNDVDPRVLQFYEAKLLGIERIAGRDAQGLALKPRDEFRFATRLWVDVSTGLLLRSEVLDTRDDVMESTGFTNLEFPLRLTVAGVLEPLRRADGFRRMLRVSKAVSLETEGWQLNHTVPGFKLVNCVQRTLPLAAEANASAPAVLQALYSDGLANVSVFIERITRSAERKPKQASHGATQTLSQPLGSEHWAIAMGDVPLTTLRQFLKGLERKQP